MCCESHVLLKDKDAHQTNNLLDDSNKSVRGPTGHTSLLPLPSSHNSSSAQSTLGRPRHTHIDLCQFFSAHQSNYGHTSTAQESADSHRESGGSVLGINLPGSPLASLTAPKCMQFNFSN
jgi:hypothetical protein